MAAHRGWISSAGDLARFLLRVDGRLAEPDLLPGPRLEQILAPPTHPTFDDREEHYGHGFFVRRGASGRAWLHDGSKPGTTSLMIRTEDGMVMVALFNGRPTRGDISRDLEATLRVAFDQIDGRADD